MSKDSRTAYFLRPGLNEGDPMWAAFDLHHGGAVLKTVLYMDGTGALTAYKLGKNKLPTKTVVASGQVHRNTSASPDAPQFVGIITTAKGTAFELALWWHADPIRPYYSVKYSEREVPRGTAFSPDILACA